MKTTLRSNEIRQLVLRTFKELGVQDITSMTDTLLIRDGRCLGRSYRVSTLMAMWIVDAGIIQFYDKEGQMLRTINIFEELKPHRMAA